MRQSFRTYPPWARINLAIFVVASFLTLISSTIARAQDSCPLSASGIGHADCDADGSAQHHHPVLRATRTDSDAAGLLAFIMPGARAFIDVQVPAPAQLVPSVQPAHYPPRSGVPIYRIAPKNSDPSHHLV